MKRILFASFIGFIPVLLSPGCINARQIINSSEFVQDDTIYSIQVSRADDETSATAKTYTEKVNTRAAYDFIKSFKQAEYVKWYKTSEGLTAYFNINGIKMRAAYNSKGNRLYVLRFYDEDHLSSDIRRRVKTVYYDFTITWIDEVQINDKTTYFINLEDKSCCKILRIGEDEMEVAKEFLK
jgi:hypothetical protein